MFRYKINKWIVAFVAAASLTSCTDFLDVVPDNVATLDYAFRDKNGAFKYLATCYSALPSPASWSSNPGFAGSDEYWHYSDCISSSWKLTSQNVDDPLINEWSGGNCYKGIRYCNTFLENIGKVGPDLAQDERERMIAEVKALKAFYHFYLLRMYGPIVLVKENLPVSASSEEVAQYRSPFDECVEYISSLYDEAINNEFLPDNILDREDELGRLTRVAVLTMKTDLWMTAASPLFNGNQEYANFTDSRGVKLFPQAYDKEKWVKAYETAKQAVELADNSGYELYKYAATSSEALSDTTIMLESLRGAVTARPIYNFETIFACQADPVILAKGTMPFFTGTQDENWIWGSIVGYCPPLHIIKDCFYTNHGIPIDNDVTYPNKDNLYGWTATRDIKDHKYYILEDEHGTANLHINREPRFYSSVGFDGCIWYGNGRYKEHMTPGALATETSWRLRMRAGQTPGKVQSLRYYITGYLVKKLSNVQTAASSDDKKANYVRFNFPMYRLADLYLMYTECANEASDKNVYDPKDPIFTYINKVRERAGLEGVVESWEKYSNDPSKPLTKEGLREVIKMERSSELCFEGKRYWDLRRWKDLLKVNNVIIQGWDIDQKRNDTDPAKGNNDFYTVKNLGRIQLSTRNYLWPIRVQDLRINTHLCQNPGW